MESTDSSTVSILTETITSTVTFSWYDYILFSVMLLFSALIGIYFGCFGSKQSTTSEYLMGGKTMKVIPIAVSLVASHTSGITILALPADVYRYGAAYWLGSFSMVIVCIVTIYVYLPVFFDLQITSTYEYLERRFDSRARSFASFLFALSVFLYLPVVVYIPALAFSAATGIGVHSIAPVVCGICIFYTTIGGLKAVVWTDTLQFVVTVITIATVYILGVKSAGGFSTVWDKAIEGGRLDIFDFDPDPTKRDSFWIIIIGLTVHWIGHTSVNQSYIQKFLSISSFRDSAKSVIYFTFGMVVIKTACVLTGFVMFAKYSDCDPFTTGEVKRNDQLLPYYVIDVARNIPGLSGLFIAGIFSTALSTLSATLNCLAGTLYEDFISKMIKKNISQKTASNILKLIVVVTGVTCTCLVYVTERLGGLLPLAISLGGVTNGILLGMFTVGLLFPKANSKGVYYGAIGGLVFISCIVFPAKYYQSRGLFKYPPKPLSTDACDFSNTTDLLSVLFDNVTTPVYPTNDTVNLKPSENQLHFVFRISYYYYTLIGTVVTMTLGLAISYMTNQNDPPVDRNLISPISRFLLPKEAENLDNVEYRSVEEALNVLCSSSRKIEEQNGDMNSTKLIQNK